VPLTPDVRWLVLGSPAYFAARGRPQRPEDPIDHVCLRCRFPISRSVYRWEFLRDGKEFSIDVPGKLLLNDSMLFHAVACQGLGPIYTTDAAATQELLEGRLESVLEPYLPTSPGLFPVFPQPKPIPTEAPGLHRYCREAGQAASKHCRDLDIEADAHPRSSAQVSTATFLRCRETRSKRVATNSKDITCAAIEGARHATDHPLSRDIHHRRGLFDIKRSACR
jgi:hypothetical protein